MNLAIQQFPTILPLQVGFVLLFLYKSFPFSPVTQSHVSSVDAISVKFKISENEAATSQEPQLYANGAETQSEMRLMTRDLKKKLFGR